MHGTSFLQDAKNVDVLANKVPIAYVSAKSAQSSALQASLANLKAVAPAHPLLMDLEEKDALFDEALKTHREALSAAG